MEGTQFPSNESETFDSEEVDESKRRRNYRIRKCHFQWSPNATRRLIACVKSFENLWNPFHFSYKDRVVHQKTWQSIAEALSLPKQEVVVKWNSLRSNYRIYLKSQLERSKNGQSGKPRKPNPYFMAMDFLGRILKFDDVKNSESDLTKIENSKKLKAGGRSRSSSVFTDLDRVVLDIINKDSTSVSEIKDEIASLSSEEILPSVSQHEDDSQQESRLPTLTAHMNICKKRKIRSWEDEEEEQADRESREWKEREWKEQDWKDQEAKEREDEDLNYLKKQKLRLEIYNLQLDAMRKEIDLGLSRSELTAGLYKTWVVPLKEET